MNNIKALVIVPPNITFESFRWPKNNTKTWRHKSGCELGVIITDVPLGAITISALLKEKHKAEVVVHDFNVALHKEWNNPDDLNFNDYFIESIENLDFAPNLICFSSLFVTGFTNLVDLSKTCRKLFPDALIIAGGNVPTTMYKDIYAEDGGAIDALCYGEGEIPLEELLGASDLTAYLADSTSWITRENYLKIPKFEHKFIDDLDEVPYLDYDSINLEDYHHSPTIKAYTQIEDTENYVTYMTSRGCPFLCTFCSAHAVHGRKVRGFSLDRVRDELTQLVTKYRVKTLVLEDDHFLNDNDRATAILKIAQSLGLVCVFPNALALYALDKKMLQELVATGIRQLTLAVESGSQRVLKELMRKPLKTSITKRVAEDCWDLGIYTDCNIIIGMPGETMDDITEAREFLKTIPTNWYRINVATPLSGSEMYEKAVENGNLIGDIKKAGYKSCVISTSHFLPHEINRIAYEMNIELNFVHNTDMERGNYKRAAESFENVLKLKHDHAFAKYYLSKCLHELGQNSESERLMASALLDAKNDPIWMNFAKKFDVTELISEFELADG